MKKSYIVTFIVLLIDQLSKIYVKLILISMKALKFSIKIGGIDFHVENPGMAYGLQFGGFTWQICTCDHQNFLNWRNDLSF